MVEVARGDRKEEKELDSDSTFYMPHTPRRNVRLQEGVAGVDR